MLWSCVCVLSYSHMGIYLHVKTMWAGCNVFRLYNVYHSLLFQIIGSTLKCTSSLIYDLAATSYSHRSLFSFHSSISNMYHLCIKITSWKMLLYYILWDARSNLTFFMQGNQACEKIKKRRNSPVTLNICVSGHKHITSALNGLYQYKKFYSQR